GFVAGSIVSLPYVLPMLTVAFSLGALAGLIAMVYQKKNMKSQIPFAPFLVSGTIIILFLAKAFPLWLYFFIIP
ncbi:MAG TPA: hypothetical protein VJH89_01515, partial [Patescibacteria group bacterium]|nr:hypothetical protein [Patescibacteria group bacterium]